MKTKYKVNIELTEAALRDFKAIQNHSNFKVSEWGQKYLKGLLEFPPKGWLEVRRHWTDGIFKVNEVIPFDIQGKVQHDFAHQTLTVLITKFKLKTHHSRVWFERVDHQAWFKEAARLN